jgi:hypothetical protein
MLIRHWLTGSGFCFSPDEGGGGSVPTEPDSGTTQVTEPTSGVGESAASPTDSPSDSPFSLREYAKGAGWSAADSYPDDKAAAEALFNQVRGIGSQVQQLRQYQNFYNQHAADLKAYHQWKAQQTQAAQAPQQPEKPKWQVPEYDPEWLKHLQEDENGNLVPRHQWVSPDLPQKVMAYRKWQSEQLRSLLHSPADWIQQHIGDYVSKASQEAIQSYQKEFLPRFDMESFVYRNQDWMYQQDEHGRPVIHPSTGQKVWSREGAMFANNVKTVTQMFPDMDHRKVMEAAAHFTNEQIEAARSGQTQRTDSRTAYNNGVPPRSPDGTVGQRNGSSVSSAANRIPQNKNLDLREMMKQNFESAGLR